MSALAAANYRPQRVSIARYRLYPKQRDIADWQQDHDRQIYTAATAAGARQTGWSAARLYADICYLQSDRFAIGGVPYVRKRELLPLVRRQGGGKARGRHGPWRLLQRRLRVLVAGGFVDDFGDKVLARTREDDGPILPKDLHISGGYPTSLSPPQTAFLTVNSGPNRRSNERRPLYIARRRVCAPSRRGHHAATMPRCPRGRFASAPPMPPPPTPTKSTEVPIVGISEDLMPFLGDLFTAFDEREEIKNSVAAPEGPPAQVRLTEDLFGFEAAPHGAHPKPHWPPKASFEPPDGIGDADAPTNPSQDRAAAGAGHAYGAAGHRVNNFLKKEPTAPSAPAVRTRWDMGQNEFHEWAQMVSYHGVRLGFEADLSPKQLQTIEWARGADKRRKLEKAKAEWQRQRALEEERAALNRVVEEARAALHRERRTGWAFADDALPADRPWLVAHLSKSKALARCMLWALNKPALPRRCWRMAAAELLMGDPRYSKKNPAAFVWSVAERQSRKSELGLDDAQWGDPRGKKGFRVNPNWDDGVFALAGIVRPTG